LEKYLIDSLMVLRLLRRATINVIYYAAGEIQPVRPLLATATQQGAYQDKAARVPPLAVPSCPRAPPNDPEDEGGRATGFPFPQMACRRVRD